MNEKDKEALKAALPQYVESITTRDARAGRNMYVCPLCGSGTGKGKGKANGAFSIKDGSAWHCFSCEKGGDIFDLIREHEGLEDFLDQAARAAEIAGITLDSPADPGRQLPTMTGEDKYKKTFSWEKSPQPVRSGKFKDYIDQCQASAYQTGYFEQRGFDWNDIERFGLGYDPEKDLIVIPYDSQGSYYITRNTTKPNEKEGRFIGKPSADEAGPEPVYNYAALSSDLPCFVTEAPLDAISIMKSGEGKCNGIATGGTSHMKLLKAIQGKTPPCVFVLSYDNDEQGQAAQTALAEDLEKWDVPYVLAEYSLQEYREAMRKDPNDLLRSNPDQLREDIAANIRRAELRRNKELFELMQQHQATAGSNNLQGFIDLLDGKPSDIATDPIKTGFKELDSKIEGGLFPGALYILGAISSLGKSTFLIQMADQIAQSGHDALYISLEMSRHELIAKSISRLSYTTAGKNDKWKAKTVTGILSKDRYKDYGQAVKEHLRSCIDLYREYAGHLYIYEGVGSVGVEQIKDIVKGHKTETGKAPVVLIDYAQILAPYDMRASDKQNVDKSILELKRLSRDYKTPVFCLSSFNRDNYDSEVNMTAFKESGALEYGSDVLMAIQPQGMKNGSDNQTKKYNNELVKTCKAARIREVELKILKQRNGLTGSSVKFNYYAHFNYFEEDKTKAAQAKKYNEELPII